MDRKDAVGSTKQVDFLAFCDRSKPANMRLALTILLETNSMMFADTVNFIDEVDIVVPVAEFKVTRSYNCDSISRFEV